MAVNAENLKPGQIYSWIDTAHENSPTYEITIVGVDPRTGHWVASCEFWSLDISYIGDEDFETMKLIKDI